MAMDGDVPDADVDLVIYVRCFRLSLQLRCSCFARRGVKEGEDRSNNNNYYYVYTLANMNNTTKRTRCRPS
jgi:hypothetical protein